MAITRCDGGVQEVAVLQSGRGFHRDFPVQFLRRPPLVRLAEAELHLGPQGEIRAVEVTDRGGWYADAPAVVALDEEGRGHGARFRAYLDQAGGVARIDVLDAGRDYSDQTHLGIYTHQHSMPEQPIPPPAAGRAHDRISVAFEQPLDARGHRVDYVVELSSRFRHYLQKFSPDRVPPPAPPSPAWVHVPRLSGPISVELASLVRPAKPDVAYLMPSFQWVVRCPATIEPGQAPTYFAGRDEGCLEISRLPMIRVYLHRPWNTSGIEQLGVLVAPAILNSMRLSETGNLQPEPPRPADGGVFNPAPSPKELSYAKEPLSGYGLPDDVRRLVSRWGFDPVWNETAFAPLTVDHFEGRAPGATCERVDLCEVDPVTMQPPPQSRQAVRLALHDVHYDGAKERWYADLRLSLREAAEGRTALPFVQLALVAYQPRGLPGDRVSPPLLCDMYKLLGRRTLRVQRRDRFHFRVVLSGEGPVSRVVREIPLVPSPARDRYAATIELEPAELAKIAGPADRAIVLSIQEYETYPAAEGALDSGGEGLLLVEDRLCARRVVYSYALDIA